MAKLDFKVIAVAIALLTLAGISYFNWDSFSLEILRFLDSNGLTFGIWAFLIITVIIHYQKSDKSNENRLSDKDGLEKPIDYALFVGTYGAIGTSIKTVGRELFARINVPDESLCKGFSNFDSVSFGAIVILLSIYFYHKVKPVVQETYIQIASVKPADNA